MIVITKSEELVSNCDVCGAINYKSAAGKPTILMVG